MGCDSKSPSIVLYTSVDDQVARPIVDEFSKSTGITVQIVTDTEATKSVGLAERLRAEKENPVCDVWWGNEPFNTIALAGEGAFISSAAGDVKDVSPQFCDAQGRWTPVGYRLRVLAVNINGDGIDKLPGLSTLIDPANRGKVAMARPVAGTCASQFAALNVAWGKEKFEKFLKDLKDNEIKLLGGNSIVAEEVARGNIRVGLTDNDDVHAAQESVKGANINPVLPDQHSFGALALPTTVAIVKDSSAARKLLDFLCSAATEKKLIDAHYAYGSIHEINRVKTMDVDYTKAAAELRTTIRRVQEILEDR